MKYFPSIIIIITKNVGLQPPAMEIVQQQRHIHILSSSFVIMEGKIKHVHHIW